MPLLRELMAQILRECLRRMWLGSVVGAVFVWLLLTSSAWKAASVAMAHADLASAVWIGSWSRPTTATPQVITVGIGIDAYQRDFGGRSPLDRTVLARHVQALLADLPPGSLLVVDLDVSPSAGSPHGDALDRLWIDHASRVVLSLPVLNPGPDTLSWRTWIQQQGVVFGSPSIDRSFGLLDPGHDFSGSLSDVAAQRLMAGTARAAMLPPASAPRVNRVALSPSTLAAPVVLPLGKWTPGTLTALQPRAVVLGAMWPGADSFDTPFGPRNGALVHAAKLAGQLEGRRTLPSVLQVMAAILATAVCVTVARRAAHLLAPTGPPTTNDVLAQFGRGQLRRLGVVVVVLACLLVLLLITAALRHWGWGLSSLILVGFSLLSVIGGWANDITRELQDGAAQSAPVPKPDLLAEFLVPVRAVFQPPSLSGPTGLPRQLLLLAFVAGRMVLPLSAIIYLSTR